MEKKIIPPTPKKRLSTDSESNLAKKPPYLLGLLGIIPLVGALVGFVLILYGLIKYKDKWLVLIGAGGILFTVAIYGSMFYTMGPDSKAFKQGFAKIDSIQLNSLVKEIEFYKIQNGSYPDSLQQLNTKDSFTGISDPLLSRKKNSTYNYHKIGNKYTLFSSGVDEIPNTADDIYPTIDTTHTGLIIKGK